MPSRLLGLPLSEVKYLFRGLVRSPLVSIGIVALLGAGVSLMMLLFSVFKAAVVDAAPYPAANRLMIVAKAPRDVPSLKTGLTPREFNLVRSAASAFDAVEFYTPPAFVALAGAGPLERILATSVSPGLLPLLGITPGVGRGFVSEDFSTGRVVIVSDGLWRDYLGRSSDVLGRTVVVGGAPRTIVGVLPPDVAFPRTGIQAWMPESYESSRAQGSTRLTIGRLTGQRSPVQASDELSRLAVLDSVETESTRLTVTSLRDQVVGAFGESVGALMVAGAMVLWVACANAASLLLARNVRRTRDWAVRLTLGASSWQLRLQCVLEALLLAAGGAAASLAMTWYATALIRKFGPLLFPRLSAVQVDGTVIACGIAMASTTAVVVGVISASRLPSGSQDVLPSIESVGWRPGGGKWRPGPFRLMLATQIGAVGALAVAAALVLAAIGRLVAVDLGFAPHNVMVVRFDSVELGQEVETLLSDLRSDSRVGAAAATSLAPLSGVGFHSVFSMDFGPEGWKASPWVMRQVVTDDYFATMQVPLIEGRLFSADARMGAPCEAVINRLLALSLWPGRNPLGDVIDLNGSERGPATANRRLCTIVGVVGNTRDVSLETEPEPAFYLLQRQWPRTAISGLLVKSTGEPMQLRSRVESALLRVKPTIRVQFSSMDAEIEKAIAVPRVYQEILSWFTGACLILAVTGVYGLTTDAIVQRRKEIGVRMALGAGRVRLRLTVLREVAGVTVAGTLLGIVAAWWFAHLVGAFIALPAGGRQWIVVGVPAVVAMASLGASVLATLRITGREPTELLTRV
jgi:putative ABC transport system permease protein